MTCQPDAAPYTVEGLADLGNEPGSSAMSVMTPGKSRGRGMSAAAIAKALGPACHGGEWRRYRRMAAKARRLPLGMESGHAGCSRRDVSAEVRRIGLLD